MVSYGESPPASASLERAIPCTAGYTVAADWPNIPPHRLCCSAAISSGGLPAWIHFYELSLPSIPDVWINSFKSVAFMVISVLSSRSLRGNSATYAPTLDVWNDQRLCNPAHSGNIFVSPERYIFNARCSRGSFWIACCVLSEVWREDKCLFTCVLLYGMYRILQIMSPAKFLVVLQELSVLSIRLFSAASWQPYSAKRHVFLNMATPTSGHTQNLAYCAVSNTKFTRKKSN